MKLLLSTLLVSALLFTSVKANEPLTFLQKSALERATILNAMEKAKTWQEAQHKGAVPTNWLTGTLYTGVCASYEATQNEEYLNAARDWCISAKWECGHNRPLHADDICSAQTFLDVYMHDKNPEYIKHIKSIIDDYYFTDTISRKLLGHATWKGSEAEFNGRNLWWWCDALYMAPPLLARLAYVTNDDKYYDLLHELYWDATEYLYDTEEFLFYRDDRFFDTRTPNDEKVFWSRGNGWVIGGLVRTIDYLKDSDPMKQKYIDLFEEMMMRLARLQGEDGLWRSSVNDPEWLTQPESSASSFFTFGLAAGIERGWLDERTYMPYLVKGWEGLLSCLREDGKLEWAQPVDDQPHRVRHEDHKNYAQGAFLLAASEVYKLNVTPEKYAQVMGDRRLVKFADNGAWTWYNDERTIFWNKHLLVGYVKDNGHSSMSYYLQPGQSNQIRLKQVELSSWVDVDDHDNPAFLPFNKDSVLAVYATHGHTKMMNARTLYSNLSMSDERTYNMGSNVTYSNLYQLEDGTIFNFFRGHGWNPNLTTSTDGGRTWAESTMIFKSGGNSTRPYVKYASDGKNRIDIFYTDGHPRNEKTNNVYHQYYENGKFYTSSGKKVRSLDKINEKPLLPTEGTKIFDGSGADGRGWVYDFERGENGELAGAYICSPDGDAGMDLRYRYARFNPKTKKWSEQEIAFAGRNIYVPENHYAGGISIDPSNINVVYLSSLRNPKTGEPNGTGKFQIFKGVTNDKGATWEYEQITFDLENDNLRPIVPRNKPNSINECVLWFRGDYKSYTKYKSEVVGYISKK